MNNIIKLVIMVFIAILSIFIIYKNSTPWINLLFYSIFSFIIGIVFSILIKIFSKVNNNQDFITCSYEIIIFLAILIFFVLLIENFSYGKYLYIIFLSGIFYYLGLLIYNKFIGVYSNASYVVSICITSLFIFCFYYVNDFTLNKEYEKLRNPLIIDNAINKVTQFMILLVQSFLKN